MTKKIKTPKEKQIEQLKKARTSILVAQGFERGRKIEQLPIKYQEYIKLRCEVFNSQPEELIDLKLALSEEVWVKQEVETLDRLLVIPTGKYKDPRRVASIYQQKFVEYLREVCPEIIEELKQCVPLFEALFSRKKSGYRFIITDLQERLLPFALPLRNRLSDRPFEEDYYWGEYSYLFYYLKKDSNGLSKEDKLLLEQELVDLNLVRNTIIEAFVGVAANKEESHVYLITLLQNLLKWADEYNLKKDWLINYALYFIYQFSVNEILDSGTIEIGALEDFTFEGNPFVLSPIRGWRPGEEDKEAYEIEITEYFLSNLKKYFNSTYHHLDLGKQEKGYSLKYEQAEWAVKWTVQRKTIETIAQEDSDKTEKGDRSISHSTVKKALYKLASYGLPVVPALEKKSPPKSQKIFPDK